MNIFVYAFRGDAQDHTAHHAWLQSLVHSDEAYAVSDQVLGSFLRIVTNPRIFPIPAPLEEALKFVSEFRNRPNAMAITPGVRHWDIFTQLCRDVGARGNLVPDAWLAALAIESGCEFITTDRDFARFRGLRWKHPLAG